MSARRKDVTIFIPGHGPMQILEDGSKNHDGQRLDTQSRPVPEGITSSVEAYLRASQDLLEGKYAYIQDLAPTHLANSGTVLILQCRDGLVVRYDRKRDATCVVGASTEDTVARVVLKLSEGVVHCHGANEDVSGSDEPGRELTLFSQNVAGEKRRKLVSFRLSLSATVKKPDSFPKPPQKPYCLLSAQNKFALHLEGELLPQTTDRTDGQHFLTRTVCRFPVGWECIEVFPFLDLEHWKPEYAPIWAEHDLLAAVMSRQHTERYFQSLDPKAAVRREYAELLDQFKNLLDSEPDREETLQAFLREHPTLLCPTYKRIWPKLRLGNRVTDFVFRDAAGAYLLVELERSTHLLFTKQGQQSAKLTEARAQVTDWKRFLEDNLSYAKGDLGLNDISTTPHDLIVIGRSKALTAENRRKLTTYENQSPKSKIMTYDDVYENAKAAIENLLGPLWQAGSHTEIYYL